MHHRCHWVWTPRVGFRTWCSIWSTCTRWSGYGTADSLLQPQMPGGSSRDVTLPPARPRSSSASAPPAGAESASRPHPHPHTHTHTPKWKTCIVWWPQWMKHCAKRPRPSANWGRRMICIGLGWSTKAFGCVHVSGVLQGEGSRSSRSLSRHRERRSLPPRGRAELRSLGRPRHIDDAHKEPIPSSSRWATRSARINWWPTLG